MPISFNSFPDNWKLPLHWVEVDPSRAGTFIARLPALLVGQMLSTGLALPNIPIAVGSQEQADEFFGVGSMLSRMVTAFIRSNTAQELWCLPLVEPTSGQKATGKITITTGPENGGTVNLYIAGQRVQVGVSFDDTPAEVAANVIFAINNTGTLPVVATADFSDTNEINLSCKWKGATGNDILLMDTFQGSPGGEKLPPGMVITYTPMSGGTAAPDMVTGIANLGDEPYEYVAMPFTDTTSMDAWDTEFGFGDSGRWGWMRQSYGMIFSAKRDTYANFLADGPDENYATISVMAFEMQVPTPMYEASASYAARGARGFTNDPARPLQTLVLDIVRPAHKHFRFSKTETNNMNGVGYGVQGIDGAGKVMILRESTRWQKNSYSQPDNAFELLTTLATLATLFRRQKAAITSKFPRHKLANDGTRFGPGQAIVTPKIIKAELIAQYDADEFLGLVENVIEFKNHLIVERNAENPNRVDVLYPPDLVNQLRIFAVLAQFRLQYPSTSLAV